MRKDHLLAEAARPYCRPAQARENLNSYMLALTHMRDMASASGFGPVLKEAELVQSAGADC